MAQTLFPTIRFRDARASIAWLEAALGAETLALYEEDGHVAHAEVRIGESSLMCGDRPEGTATPPGASVVYVVVPDADAAHARAQAAGAAPSAITEQDYGSRDFTLTDPDGNRWAIGTYGGAAA
ncbi:VOC family protein [Patulibacter brassicae]|uniref:VOC family protein n=1 Tax=Patulibacter brassicae TaxID=1705717 RepID=A0ABU4VHS7_9ACTN|nr:VOC family protein [Patulibacter brassicae]MDX8151359.1 VOC family protein [Patulibacter brassicae]